MSINPEPKPDNNRIAITVTIIAALIGCVGSLGAAFILENTTTMNNHEIKTTICGGFFSMLAYILFFLEFARAIVKGELMFYDGTIHAWLARIIGVIGILGMMAGAYLGISNVVFHEVFDTASPFTWVLIFLFSLFLCVAIVELFSILRRHPK
jgi:hypothetical protein